MSSDKFQTLPTIDPNEFSTLLELLSKIKVPVKGSNAVGRSAFVHKHRACAFGDAYHFTKKTINLSRMSKKYPAIHDEIMRIGKLICEPIGFSFTSVYLNNNCISSPHKDKSNYGDLVIVSFGFYTGCKLVIENEVADAYCTPIKFDGTHHLHWNTPDLVGNKYGLVFYNHKEIIKARATGKPTVSPVTPSL